MDIEKPSDSNLLKEDVEEVGSQSQSLDSEKRDWYV